jgi:hypothetical protein
MHDHEVLVTFGHRNIVTWGATPYGESPQRFPDAKPILL